MPLSAIRRRRLSAILEHLDLGHPDSLDVGTEMSVDDRWGSGRATAGSEFESLDLGYPDNLDVGTEMSVDYCCEVTLGCGSQFLTRDYRQTEHGLII